MRTSRRYYIPQTYPMWAATFEIYPRGTDGWRDFAFMPDDELEKEVHSVDLVVGWEISGTDDGIGDGYMYAGKCMPVTEYGVINTAYGLDTTKELAKAKALFYIGNRHKDAKRWAEKYRQEHPEEFR